MSATWTAPATGTKSTTNAEAPINVSNRAQVKLGSLGTGALSVTGSAAVTGRLTVGTSLHNESDKIYVGGDCFEKKNIYVDFREQGLGQWTHISTDPDAWGNRSGTVVVLAEC
jgi:hypothetical protein